MTVRLYEANTHFRPFPDPEEVFAERVAEHRELLLPLAAVDLSFVDPSLQGTIHFIHPIEPDDACVGEGGDVAFNYLCRDNWVGYRYSGARCSVATGFDYFRLPRLRKLLSRSNAAPDSVCERLAGKRAVTELADLQLHYDEMRAGFSDRRAHFLEHGSLHHAYADGQYTRENRAELVSLGGLPLEGNWAGTDFPLVREAGLGSSKDTVLPLTEDDRPYRYIGGMDCHNFTLTHGCYLLLFYDPRTRTALTTFDWT